MSTSAETQNVQTELCLFHWKNKSLCRITPNDCGYHTRADFHLGIITEPPAAFLRGALRSRFGFQPESLKQLCQYVILEQTHNVLVEYKNDSLCIIKLPAQLVVAIPRSSLDLALHYSNTRLDKLKDKLPLDLVAELKEMKGEFCEKIKTTDDLVIDLFNKTTLGLARKKTRAKRKANRLARRKKQCTVKALIATVRYTCSRFR